LPSGTTTGVIPAKAGIQMFLFLSSRKWGKVILGFVVDFKLTDSIAAKTVPIYLLFLLVIPTGAQRSGGIYSKLHRKALPSHLAHSTAVGSLLHHS